MNRSILLVICDFLLASILAISRFDQAPMAPGEQNHASIGRPLEMNGATAPPAPVQQIPTSSTNSTARQELVDVLSLALEEERQSRQELLAQLSQTKESLQSQQSQLAEREKRIQEFQANLARKEAEAQRLANERAALEKQANNAQKTLQNLQSERETLQKQMAAAQSSVENLKQQLTTTSSEAQASKQQLLQAERQLAQRQAEAKMLQQQMQEAERVRQTAEAEKTQLASKLQVAETERRLVSEQLGTMQKEVATVRTEKEKIQEHATQLAQGVTTLAEKSGEIVQEIRQNRPLAPNTIFSDFVANRIQSDFQAVRTGLFGREVSREKVTKTVLVSDGTATYALFHVQDTPLEFQEPGTDWEWLTGNIRRKQSVIPIDQVSFLGVDPRVVAVPLAETQVQQLGAKVYSVADDPYKFQEAVVVGTDEGYYGECNFQIDPDLPNFLKMDRSVVRGLFGKFNPSRGDFVFSKSGALLGVMVNNEYCVLLTSFTPARTIRTGTSIMSQRTGLLLSQMRSRVVSLPFKLQ